jgi:hypothetical protein
MEDKKKIDVSSFPKDEKGRAIVPDAFFDGNIKDLPAGVINESKSKYSSGNGGYCNMLGSGSRDKSIQSAGGTASAERSRERKRLAESLEYLLKQPIKANTKVSEILRSIADYLPEDAEMTDILSAAMLVSAIKGNCKAAEFVRDTVGEKPTEKMDVTSNVITPEEQNLLEKVSRRINSEY